VLNSGCYKEVYNTSQKDRATATGNVDRKFAEVWPFGVWVVWANRQTYNRQTDRQTDMLITILCAHPCGVY